MFTEIMNLNPELEMTETPPFRIFLWINETENYTKPEGQVVINYKGLHVWALALAGKKHGDK